MTKLLGLFIAAASAFAQPQFDAASVKRSATSDGFSPAINAGDAGRVTLRNYPLRGIILGAYGLAGYQVEGPSWISSERYDIVATKPAGTVAAETRLMLQSLLHDRFHLTTHTVKKEMQAYVLLAGKDKSKLRPAKDVPDVPGCKSFGTMTEFADLLARNLQRPVVDQSGISGTYFFILAYSPNVAGSQSSEGSPAPPPPAPPPCPGWSAATMPPLAASIFEAVRDQMGLKLERKGSATVEVLVIDRVDKVPEGN